MDHKLAHFESFVKRIGGVLGHADRQVPFGHYCTGLLLPGDRKSVEPMAARIEPERVSSSHQSLHHFVADAPWSDAAVLGAVRDYVLERVQRIGGQPEAVLIDDTGMPKQGRHSVGVARQYCGQLGKRDNCQVAVSVSIATEAYSLPVAYRLYLPEEWADDRLRRKAAKVPEAVQFATKPEIALQLLQELKDTDALPPIAIADAGYGVNGDFRRGLQELGLQYVVGTTGQPMVWPEGTEPPPMPAWSGRGHRPVRRMPTATQHPLSVRAVALQLPSRRYRSVTWREGTNTALRSRFAAVRVHCATRGGERAELDPEQWLLIEWPAGATEPEKYFFSNLPATTPLRELVRLAKLRWRIERDYQELKQELGLGQFEGRSWRGFHHHASLCVAAYGYLVAERITTPKKTPRKALSREITALPEGYRPRGSPAAATSRPRFDRNAAARTRGAADRPAR